MSEFSFLIKSHRVKLGLTLTKAAKLIGISTSHLSNLENGIDRRSRTPIKTSPEIIKLISNAYNMNYNYLLTLQGYIDNPKVDFSENENSDVKFHLALLLKRNITLGGKELSCEEIETLKTLLDTSIDSFKKLIEYKY